jgi:hypothetical protein
MTFYYLADIRCQPHLYVFKTLLIYAAKTCLIQYDFKKKKKIPDDKIDKVVTKIVTGLSKIEDTYYLGRGLIFMNIEAEEVTDITVSNVPSIVYFKNGHPTVYEGS